jgi:hypothetical protein
LYLINKLLSIRIEKTFLVVNFFKEIKEITTQLASIGKQLHENKLVQIMLNFLLEYFKNFIQVVLGGDQIPMFNKLSTKLLLEEQ